MHSQYKRTVETMKTWAQRERSIHGIIILGSQVRTELPGDEWSDLDVLLLVEDPQQFLNAESWIREFGSPLCTSFLESKLDWLHLTWAVKRVLYSDNRAVDFSILPFARIDDVLSVNAEIHAQGYRILYDERQNSIEAKIESSLKNITAATVQIPSKEEMNHTVNEILFQLIGACKKIKRNELWVAVRQVNGEINDRLLQLIEWHTASSAPIRYEGRFLERRIQPAFLNDLSRCMTRYDSDDAVAAIGQILNLAFRLSQEISRKYGFEFDGNRFEEIRRLYREICGGKPFPSVE